MAVIGRRILIGCLKIVLEYRFPNQTALKHFILWSRAILTSGDPARSISQSAVSKGIATNIPSYTCLDGPNKGGLPVVSAYRYVDTLIRIHRNGYERVH